jgi:peptidoglycan hydrolase CwlO-like protein
MTFVGKILVIVIVAFSLIFLGLSAVTLSTRRDWKTAIDSEQKTINDLKKKLADAKGQLDSAQKGLDDTKGQFDQEKKALDTRLAAIEEENKRDLNQIKSVRDQWAASHEKTKGTMEEVQAKRTQINDLRAKIAAVDKQAREFKQHQSELTDLIRELERLLGTTEQDSADLQSR